MGETPHFFLSFMVELVGAMAYDINSSEARSHGLWSKKMEEVKRYKKIKKVKSNFIFVWL